MIYSITYNKYIIFLSSLKLSQNELMWSNTFNFRYYFRILSTLRTKLLTITISETKLCDSCCVQPTRIKLWMYSSKENQSSLYLWCSLKAVGLMTSLTQQPLHHLRRIFSQSFFDRKRKVCYLHFYTWFPASMTQDSLIPQLFLLLGCASLYTKNDLVPV
jgi:hypothetical protein